MLLIGLRKKNDSKEKNIITIFLFYVVISVKVVNYRIKTTFTIDY